MNITPLRIKEIRNVLRLTQTELALILGVTKHTVWRYEDNRGSLTDEISNKLLLLYTCVKSKSEKDKKFLLTLRKSVGGISVIAGLVTIWSTIYSIQVSNGGTLVLLTEMLKSQVGRTLFNAISEI